MLFRSGEKNPEGAGEAAMQSLLLGLGIAVVLGGAGSYFAPQLLHAMGASDAIVASGSGYARAIYGGSGTVVNVSVDAKGTSVQGDNNQGAALGRVIAGAVQAELIKQKRPGGLLAA